MIIIDFSRLKQDLSIYLDADEDLIKLRSKMDYCEEKMKHLEDGLKKNWMLI